MKNPKTFINVFIWKLLLVVLGVVVIKFILFSVIASFQEKSIPTKKVLVIGDSHIERGWKPTEFEDNIAKSAQSLLYTVAKLRRFDLNSEKTTVVIGISNITFNQKALEGADYFLERSFCYLKLREHAYLFRNFPLKWVKTFVSINATVLKSPYDNTGFAPMPEGDTLKRATNGMSVVSQKDMDNNIGFLALRQFINDNPEIKIVLVRMPLYTDNKILLNEYNFQTYINSLTKENLNVSFVDFHKHNIVSNAKYFYDWDHLNSKGADRLHNYRVKNNIIF
jgi:hypothetical protein